MLQRGGVGSPECRDVSWRIARGLPLVTCSRPDAIAEEIVSPEYLEALRRLNAVLMLTDEIPRTKWTERIAGGRHQSWGMRCARQRDGHGGSSGRSRVALAPSSYC
jgi:hypothetical protein